MQIAIVGAGFSPGEADRLRRAMATFRHTGTIHTFREKFITGMIANGYDPEFAKRCFDQIEGFGEYGFPESHAASFALLVYVSAWIKHHYPEAFCAALLNSQPMGFYAPAQLVRDAKDHGVEVRAVDVNESGWDCSLQERHEAGKESWGLNGPAVRLGFRQVKGLSEAHARRIVESRSQCGGFTSVEMFQHATHLPAAVVRRLAEADAFSSMKLTRRPAVWHALELHNDQLPLFDEPTSPISRPRATVPSCLPPMPSGQEILTDYATHGLSLKGHPVGLVRDQFEKQNIITAAELADPDHSPHGRWVKVAGLVLLRQRPATASGVVFETIEDETGSANLILWPHIYDRYRPAARHASLLLAEGYVQREGQVVHILAKKLTDLSHLLTARPLRSRDFH